LTVGERKYLDAAEFQRVGFLQEANRLFFHPLGLALSVLQITGSWDDEVLSEGMGAWVYDVAEALRAVRDDAVRDEDALREEALAVCKRLWPEGSVHLDGVWDSRDDPEGFYFADGVDTDKALAVDAVRQEHFRARFKMFGADGERVPPPTLDVQPVDWDPTTYEDDVQTTTQGEAANGG
jgi:hypothetical protein